MIATIVTVYCRPCTLESVKIEIADMKQSSRRLASVLRASAPTTCLHFKKTFMKVSKAEWLEDEACTRVMNEKESPEPPRRLEMD